MPSCPIPRGQACLMVAVAAATLAVTVPGGAQQQAHTHGRLAMDVAVDARVITLQIESPLDGFLGFERAPRTDAERKQVSDMVASLNAADRLFLPDPAAGCKLSKVDLASAVLGLGSARKGKGAGQGDGRRAGHGGGHDDHDHDHDEGDDHDHDHAADKGHGHAEGEHADIEVNITFTCATAAEARFIDVKLFEAYERIQTIDAQVASPQGQFKRTVKADAPRLSWGR